ncbi:hypothetical protein Tco_0046712 [Tanacetum coccineum]
MGELTFFLGLQVTQKDDGIFISQDKYVDEILKKFGFSTVKTASTPVETSKPLLKDAEAEDVDVHLYRSMIRSLMYLTASRPDIMFVVCTCARFQVTPKVSHLHAVKRIFRYLNGQPKLGLWYPKDSPFDLEAYTDNDYAGASLDWKSTIREYVVASSCCGQVLWIQNQMLDYGYNFMNTKIYIDNESTISIVKNPVFHSKTKHIEIRHHFIRDSNDKKLIQMSKIHTDHNVADLLTKVFDVGIFQLNKTVIKEWEDRMERAATTASSLESEQDSGNINRTQSMATLNESFPQGTSSGSGPRMERATTIASSLEAEQDSGNINRTQSMAILNESFPQGTGLVNTLGSGEDNMKLKELMDLCTKLLGKQFWNTATARTLDNGEMEITATIDGKVKIVSEASIRRHLKLEDSDGISNLPTTEIFEQLALMGYVSNSDKLTFQKGHFSPQWRFLIHTILHCLSSKKTAWEQFSSNIATAIICLATNRTFNFSKMIFDGMVKNLESKHKFLMYLRFIQVFLNKHKRLLLPHNITYIAPTLTQKLFSNMRRASKGYTGVDTLLFPTMLVQGPVVQGEGSIDSVESYHTPTSAPSTSQPPSSSPSRRTIR